MRANRKRDSGPELFLRSLLHSLGYRYRLYARELPGSPDVVFRSRRQVIFVHGCFWHQHRDPKCPLRSHPKSNVHYWAPKLRRNRERDLINERSLAKLGWKQLTIWECELGDIDALTHRLASFLSVPREAG